MAVSGLALWLTGGQPREGHPLLGTWTWAGAGPEPGAVATIEFRSDGTCTYRPPGLRPVDLRWSALGDKLTVSRWTGGVLGGGDVFDPLYQNEEYLVTPDTPDRFRWQLVSTKLTKGTPAWNPAGVCERVGPND